MNAISVAAVLVLWVASGFMALAETAFVRVSRIRLLALADEGDKRAKRLLRLLERPEQAMNSVLLLLLGAQLGAATLLGSELEPALGHVGVLVGVLVEIVIVFTLFEVIPKTFALQDRKSTRLNSSH